MARQPEVERRSKEEVRFVKWRGVAQQPEAWPDSQAEGPEVEEVAHVRKFNNCVTCPIDLRIHPRSPGPPRPFNPLRERRGMTTH